MPGLNHGIVQNKQNNVKNKCIRFTRGAIVACDGACPCRPDMNERNSDATMKARANGRGNKANIAALRLLTNNNDDSTDTDGNDNVDPGS